MIKKGWEENETDHYSGRSKESEVDIPPIDLEIIESVTSLQISFLFSNTPLIRLNLMTEFPKFLELNSWTKNPHLTANKFLFPLITPELIGCFHQGVPLVLVILVVDGMIDFILWTLRVY